tara:strand:- start:1051 stop:1155 length:105 start_codon:yes stop_codon:yes gene_type:complete
MIEIILISISMLILFVGVFILLSKSGLEDIHDKS